MSFKIANFNIGPLNPVLFIADIASNHCGELSLAKELIHACAESGVNAIKMQNFAAATIVSDYGFKNLQGIKTHQNKWKKSVFDSYDDASIPLFWTGELRTLCDHLGMAYLTSPYSIELVEEVADNVCAFKLGSGDITWHDEIRAMASHNKPILIATGASTMDEVERAMEAALSTTKEIVLMQCNTEYTANVNESDQQKIDRYKHINLRVLETYRQRWPGVPLGLSDHTHGDLTVLGAVGLFDCCVVEKHFTLDNSKEGQDHAFSMTPESWQEMANNVKS
ncbi:N-acetylneuraminate synthase family protein, partial [bacterium]|nr:N-acetylneuraminate synthase family protein [bacterium]